MHPCSETEDDIQIIKQYTLLPILLDMLARDIDTLKLYQDKIIFRHVIYYLKEVENSVYEELQSVRSRMRAQHIRVLHTETDMKGVRVEYKVRGYIHHFQMLRSLIKAELMTLLITLRRRIK